MPGQGCKIGIPLLHNDLPQRANTWINPEKSREMRTDLRAAHEIGPRKRRGGKKWECQRNPACSRGRIRNEWGETLLDGARETRIYGQWVRVNAQVTELPMLSAHADSDELMRWLSGFRRPPQRVFVVHGEPEASDALRERIERELDWPATVPLQNRSYAL